MDGIDDPHFYDLVTPDDIRRRRRVVPTESAGMWGAGSRARRRHRPGHVPARGRWHDGARSRCGPGHAGGASTEGGRRGAGGAGSRRAGRGGHANVSGEGAVRARDRAIPGHPPQPDRGRSARLFPPGARAPAAGRPLRVQCVSPVAGVHGSTRRRIRWSLAVGGHLRSARRGVRGAIGERAATTRSGNGCSPNSVTKTTAPTAYSGERFSIDSSSRTSTRRTSGVS